MKIRYSLNQSVSPEAFVRLLNETTLGLRRPLDNPKCIQGMLDNADVMVSAWDGDNLVGIARSITDFHYCCYLSDLAVAESAQGQGIGKELIRHTFTALKPGCTLILLAAPQACDYYPKIGFTQHDSAWLITSPDELTG